MLQADTWDKIVFQFFFQNFATGGSCKYVVNLLNTNRQNAAVFRLLGFPSLPSLPQLNASYCDFLARFLSNDGVASYNWKIVLENVDNITTSIRRYIGVSLCVCVCVCVHVNMCV